MPAAPAEPPAAIAVCPNSWSVNAFSVPPARARDRSSNCPRDGRNNILAQRIVETVIGRLITDEQFRAAFLAAPVGTLTGLTERGMDLTPLDQYLERGYQQKELANWATRITAVRP